jgi:hypothetical protein
MKVIVGLKVEIIRVKIPVRRRDFVYQAIHTLVYALYSCLPVRRKAAMF